MRNLIIQVINEHSLSSKCSGMIVEEREFQQEIK